MIGELDTDALRGKLGAARKRVRELETVARARKQDLRAAREQIRALTQERDAARERVRELEASKL